MLLKGIQNFYAGWISTVANSTKFSKTPPVGMSIFKQRNALTPRVYVCKVTLVFVLREFIYLNIYNMSQEDIDEHYRGEEQIERERRYEEEEDRRQEFEQDERSDPEEKETLTSEDHEN